MYHDIFLRAQKQSLDARALAALALALSFVTLADVARAEADPYYVGIRGTLGHSTNVRRSETGYTPTAGDPKPYGPTDTFYSTTLFGGVDQPIGRERFYANGTVSRNSYQELKDLDNTSYGLNVGLDWESIERLSGNFNVSVSEDQSDYTGQQINGKNLEKNTNASARVKYGLDSLLALEGSLAHSQVSFSNAALAYSNLSQNAARIGLRYKISGQLTLGTGVRFTRGDYKQYSFNRRDLDFSADWEATGQSTLNALISATKQDSSGFGPDVSGITGRLAWQYRPTGKLSFNTYVIRDTGADAGFDAYVAGYDFQTKTDVVKIGQTDLTRLSTTYGISAGYAATGKIRMTASASRTRRTLDGNQLDRIGREVAVSGTDTVTLYSLGANYAISRAWLASCNASRESRTNTGNGSYPYGATTATCSLQLTIQ